MSPPAIVTVYGDLSSVDMTIAGPLGLEYSLDALGGLMRAGESERYNEAAWP